MSVKITLIGAGSVVFAKNLIGDVLQFPDLADAHICLMDIDPTRLKVAEVMTQKIIRKLGVRATVSATTDRRKAVTGAKYVICTVQVGGYKPGTVIDFEIPKKFGLEQTIADTLGVGGIFRALRTIPVLVGLAEDIAAVGAPGCLLLNYTNPMAMNCWAVNRATGIPHVGLCHSVQGTSAQLAAFAGLPTEDVNYLVAGINHMAFFLKFEYRGQDAYPLLFKALEDPERQAELVRFEMMRRLGYFVTESSEHQSEYVPYFIHHGKEIIERFNIPIDEYLRRCEIIISTWERTEKDLIGGDGDIYVPAQTHEYGSYIIHSCETDINRVVYGNVPNRGLITNLPEDCCVEVPCLVNRNGLQPTVIGALPPQLAAICQTNVNAQGLAVEAALTGNREAIYHAVMLDPHTSATLTLDKIWAMCDELIEAHQKVGLLGEFKPTIKNTGRSAQGITDRVVARLHPAVNLSQECELTLTVENPRSENFSAEFSLSSTDTPIEVIPAVNVKVPAGESVQLPLKVRFVNEPQDQEKVLLSTDVESVLAIGATLTRRIVLKTTDATPAPFALTLAGFPAASGNISSNAAGVMVKIQVNDSKLPEVFDAAPWLTSRVELYFASPQGEHGTTFAFLPTSTHPTAKVWNYEINQFVEDNSIEAHVKATPIDYELEAFLPWKVLKMSQGAFLFDCRIWLLALGDAHSGGYTRLSADSGGERGTAHFCLVTQK